MNNLNKEIVHTQNVYANLGKLRRQDCVSHFSLTPFTPLIHALIPVSLIPVLPLTYFYYYSGAEPQTLVSFLNFSWKPKYQVFRPGFLPVL